MFRVARARSLASQKSARVGTTQTVICRQRLSSSRNHVQCQMAPLAVSHQRQQGQNGGSRGQSTNWRRRIGWIVGTLGGGLLSTSVLADDDNASRVLPDHVLRSSLDKHEDRQEVAVSGGAPVKEIHSDWFSANMPCEDTFSINTELSEQYGVPGAMFGVFDGHSGGAASAFCRDNLIGAVLEDYKRRQDISPGERVPVLSADSFKAADEEFLQSCLKTSPQDGLSGACVVMTHVDDTHITAAWAGDCRAVVGRLTEDASGWTAVELTQDHQIDTHPGERERLLREHPDEPDVLYHDRVKGRLQPTRGFGDGVYKLAEYYQYIPRVHYRYTDTGWHPPYTTVEAEVTRHRIEPQDGFMVLATDGLFQDLSSQQVVDYVGQYVSTHRQSDGRIASSASSGSGVLKPEMPVPGNAASYLVQRALHHASISMIRRLNNRYRTGIVIPEYSEREHLTAMISMKSSGRRNVHDDVTVVVVFFDKHDPRKPATTPVSRL